jgi:phosphatidylglycerophosphatase A
MLGKNLKEQLAVIIASWGYTGFIPSFAKEDMGGTWGSLFATPVCFAYLWACRSASILPDGSADHMGMITRYAFILIYVYFLGRLSIGLAEKVIGPRVWKGKVRNHYQNQIVIDEAWGMFITYYSIFLGFSNVALFSWQMIIILILGFGYFRIFDIMKFWPVKIFDRKQSPFGVMMDDGVTGIQAGVLLHLTAWLIF